MKREYPRKRFLYLLIVCIFMFFHSCGHPDEEEQTGTGGGSSGSTGTTTAASLSLGLSQVSVKSDNSNSSTITATVLANDNTPLEGITVAFTTTGGVISAASATTDSDGECEITFSAGPERSNQTVTITATVTGLTPRQIPVQITGSTVTLTTDSTGLEIGGDDTATLTITVRDAGSVAIYDTTVTASVDTTSTGTASLSASTGNTDVTGVLTLDVTGTAAGSVIVNVTAVGATASKTYTVGATGAVFGITSPTQDPYSLNTNTDLTVTVNAPGMSNVIFGTTIGVWDGGTDTVVTKAVASDTASATLRSTVAGVATVQVFDNDDSSTSDSMTIAISAPSSEAAKIALQASSNVVAPSSGSTTNTISLTATVKNASDQVVGSSPVSFSILNPTGGGETISPVIVYTNDYGVANSTFSAGSLSSDAEGLTVIVRVVGCALTGPSNSIAFVDSNPDTITRSDGGSFITNGFADGDVITVIGSYSNDGSYTVQTAAANTLTLAVTEALTAETAGETVVVGTIVDSIPIVIGGTAGSVMIGQATTISSINSNTAYQLPMSVLVSDSNGNPMSGTEVSLKIWPTEYATGTAICTHTGEFSNEDVNENLILDSGEDINLDGQLTPPNSAAGTVPGTVETDENGVANFNLIYLKESACWIEVEITASTLVLGSETQTKYQFWLGYINSAAEIAALPPSPYGP